MKLTDLDVARYWAKVDKRSAEECWPWTGAKAKGYGRLWVGTRKDHHVYQATHIAYFLHHGVDPNGLLVCHECDHRWCVNPFCLWLGDSQENAMDMMQKGRGKYVLPNQKGESHSQCKLTNEQVSEIRAMYIPRQVTQQAIADKFGVSREHVRDILLGRKR